MKKSGVFLFFLLSSLLFISPVTNAQSVAGRDTLLLFIKREFNTGVSLSVNSEREELRTDETRNFEKIFKGDARGWWGTRSWFFLPSKEEIRQFSLEAAPFFGKGDLIDSTAAKVIDAEQKLMGIRGKIQAGYMARFYYDRKNYTLVNVSAWGLYDLYKRDASGIQIDSNRIETPYSKTSENSKLRYGLQAKAGWGRGRMNPMNHYTAAALILEKHYPGRIFSDDEILTVAGEIRRIKHRRNEKTSRIAENEAEQLAQFLNSELLLQLPENLLTDWELTEFRPRLNGSRIEFGPFFSYFNREPDFVYGGYLKLENRKYSGHKMSRNMGAALSYNAYKRDDWVLLETHLGWSLYPSLKSEYGFGIKYIPGMMIRKIDDLGKVRHNFVPYLEYFSQLNSKYRVETALAWRIAPNDRFMIPGPEMNITFYRSRY